MYFDGTGICLYSKRLEKGRFAAPWKQARKSTIEMTLSELSLIVEGSEATGRMTLSPPLVTKADLRSKFPEATPQKKMSPGNFFSPSGVSHCVTLYDVSDIETVRAMALLLEAENQTLAREVAKLRREVHDVRGGAAVISTLGTSSTKSSRKSTSLNDGS